MDATGFYSIETFNDCERRSLLRETLDVWDGIHSGFVTLPMEWGYRVPHGILYANEPSDAMRNFISLVEKAM